MPVLLQINITANWGSHGRIAEEIGQLVMSLGWDSYIAYGRRAKPSKSRLIHVGSMWDERWHGLQSRLFDNHGLGSKEATMGLINNIRCIKPDIIHLHNIHGYYLNYPLLFEFLSQIDTPVVWTLHDCWPFTGHCAFYTYAQCRKWMTGCVKCPQLQAYPRSFFMDQSKRNYSLKKQWFTRKKNIWLVTVSKWLKDEVSQSFLKGHVVQLIHNGVDVDVFSPMASIDARRILNLPPKARIILGVASIWEPRKGLVDFIQLRTMLPKEDLIVLIGLTQKQLNHLPQGILGIQRTENVCQLVAYYAAADVLVNPTYEDNFPTVNLEALACGTPVITYRTGGSPESIDDKTGIVVEPGNMTMLAQAIDEICDNWNRSQTRQDCRSRAICLFDKNKRYQEYIDLYQSIIKE